MVDWSTLLLSAQAEMKACGEILSKVPAGSPLMRDVLHAEASEHAAGAMVQMARLLAALQRGEDA